MINKLIGTKVKTETKMSQEMMEALTFFEFDCNFPNRSTCTPGEVKAFLKEKDATGKLAKDFHVGMMSKAPT